MSRSSVNPPRLALAALALAATFACGRPAKPPAAPPAPKAAVAAAPVVKEEPKPAPEPVREWSYTSVGKRDPFRSFLAEVENASQVVASRCKSPVGKFEVDQLRLVAVVTGLDDPVAMVEAPNGIGYTLRRGDCLGRNGGTVSAVRTGEVVVSEWAIKADGSRDKTQTLLQLPQEAALQIEE